MSGVASDSFSRSCQLTPVFFLRGFYAQPRYFGLCLVYCNFFCSVQLISFGGLPFSQMKQRGNGFMGERVGGSPGEVEGEETLGCFIREKKSSSSWFSLRSMSCLVSDFQTPGSVSHLFQLIE